ncbi:MAG: LysM peptidoglycan-binding domain-containing protein [Candidatus Riflebacteria bacterium]|nr:LysM peptidoglycan-binding domain-containing protein [Candidatus Riflebacteria bacterium]
MRQRVRIIALLAGLFLSGSAISAIPMLGGHFLEKGIGLKESKPLFLAHIYNSGKEELNLKKLSLGIELNSENGKKTFEVEAKENLPPGEIRTIRINLPGPYNSKKGTFRIFGKLNDRMYYSNLYSFSNTKLLESANSEISLYKEAPSELPSSSSSEILPDVFGEIDKPIQKPSSQKAEIKEFKKGRKNSETSSAKPEKSHLNEAKKEEKPIDKSKIDLKNLKVTKRKIDGKEFKSLRTIDEELIIYIVKPGDTLKTIAEKYYNEAKSSKVISELNFIEPDAKLRGGEEIIVEVKPLHEKENSEKISAGKNQNFETPLPEDDKSVSENLKNSPKGNSKESPGNDKTYLVQKGDTIGIIAKKLLGKSSKANLIIKANPALNPKNLKIGMKVIIPSVSEEKTS